MNISLHTNSASCWLKSMFVVVEGYMRTFSACGFGEFVYCHNFEYQCCPQSTSAVRYVLLPECETLGIYGSWWKSLKIWKCWVRKIWVDQDTEAQSFCLTSLYSKEFLLKIDHLYLNRLGMLISSQPRNSRIKRAPLYWVSPKRKMNHLAVRSVQSSCWTSISQQWY